MSFILKTNNRKVRSGSTIRAKIVSPDQKDFAVKDYPVLVQIQSLSDYDRVIRDAQQIGAILDAANDWNNITECIEELSSALQANSNGSNVSIREMTNGIANGITYIGLDGNVQTRPKYNPESPNQGHMVTLVIDVRYNEAHTTVEKEFKIPAYTNFDIINTIKNNFTSDVLWNYLKKDNIDPNFIFSDFNDLEDPDVQAEIIQEIGISNMFDANIEGSVPVLEVTPPDYYTNLFEGKTSYNRISATDMYQLDRASYTINKVTDNVLRPMFSALGIDSSADKIRGNVIAYSMKSKGTANNEYVATWSLGEGTGSTCRVSKSIGFLSELISNAQVRNNISKSAHIGWFLPENIFSDLGLTDESCTNTQTSSRKEIIIPADKNVFLRLPKKISDLVTSEDNIIADDDTNPIGYYINEVRTTEGFTNNMFTFKIELDKDAYTFDYVNFDDELDTSFATKGRSFDSTEIGTAEYIAIPKDQFTTEVKGVLNIIPYENTLTGSTANISIYFKLKRAAAE